MKAEIKVGYTPERIKIEIEFVPETEFGFKNQMAQILELTEQRVREALSDLGWLSPEKKEKLETLVDGLDETHWIAVELRNILNGED